MCQNKIKNIARQRKKKDEEERIADDKIFYLGCNLMDFWSGN